MIKKHRILHFVSHPIQYQAPMFRLLAQKDEIDLSVIFYWPPKSSNNFDSGFGREIAWDVPLLTGYQYEYLINDTNQKSFLKKLIALWKIIDKKKFNVVWTHGYADFYTLSAIVIARLKGLKVLVRGDSCLFPSESKINFQKIKRKFYFKCIDWFIDGYLSIGTSNRDFYFQYGVPDKKIFSSIYAVDNDFFYQKSIDTNNNAEKLKAELKLDPSRPVIVYASKFIERKYPIDLLNAYKTMREKINPMPYLLFIGSGETFEAVKSAASDIKDNAVQFLGFKNQTELPSYFAITDVLVLPAKYENWGLIINEAMNAECAIVVSDQVGCALDLVKSGENGFIFPARDVELLAECLTNILSDHERCEKMKKRSREIISTWGLEESVAGLIAACDSIRK